MPYCVQIQDSKRDAASSRALLTRKSTGAALPQSSTSFGQVTISGRHGRQAPGHEPFNSSERTALDTDVSVAYTNQRGSDELLSQLQRLQALQLEAQSLLM